MRAATPVVFVLGGGNDGPGEAFLHPSMRLWEAPLG